MKVRTLEEICKTDGTFAREHLGSVYCQLSYTNPIDCPYHSESHDDGIYKCTNPLYNYLEGTKQ